MASRSGPARTFTDAPAVRRRVPLIVGLTGPSWSGKTYTALELATGIQTVYGGEIWGIDTEGGRMNHYADVFKFRHVPFAPPHGPLDYMAAIDHCVGKGAKIILIDSMSHEHSGDGGVMDQIEKYLDQKCGDDWAQRLRNNQSAHIKPKAARKRLNLHIEQLAAEVVFILCYRAAEKLEFKAGEEPTKLGWKADTTSILPYAMVVRFLLPAGSYGAPLLKPTTPAEALQMKLPGWCEGWLKPGQVLSRAFGERLARWTMGGEAPGRVSATDAATGTPDGKASLREADEAPESDGMGSLFETEGAPPPEDVALDWIADCHAIRDKDVAGYRALAARLKSAGLPENVRALIRGPLEAAKKRAS